LSSIDIRSTTGQGRHWDKAAAFVVLAALGPVVMLGLEAGTAARIWAFVAGAKVEPSPTLLFAPGADIILWAWVVFFVVLALVYAVETPARDDYEKFADEVGGDFVIPEPESGPEPAPRSEPRIAIPEVQPTAERQGEALPIVHSLPEAQAWFKKGGELYAQRRYEEAISRFDRALNIYPRLASAWAGKGLASNAIGQYQEAIRCFDEALRLDPRDAAVWHDKGNVLSAIGRLEGALGCFNEALVLDARDAGAWNNKGVCLAALGRPEEAVACCDKALALDPTYVTAWQAKGLIEERLGHLAQAIAAYNQFIELSQDRDAAAAERVRLHIRALESPTQAESAPAAVNVVRDRAPTS
jgi:tetratricopeptide (TPR) repeat protein